MTDSERIRSRTNLNRSAFSRKYHIPARTLEDWDTGKRTPPAYVMELLERVVELDYPSKSKIIAHTPLREGEMAIIELDGKTYKRRVYFNTTVGLYVIIDYKMYFEYEMEYDLK